MTSLRAALPLPPEASPVANHTKPVSFVTDKELKGAFAPGKAFQACSHICE